MLFRPPTGAAAEPASRCRSGRRGPANLCSRRAYPRSSRLCCRKRSSKSRRGPRYTADYQARISGPLLDRIDLQIEVPAISVRQCRTSLAQRSCAKPLKHSGDRPAASTARSRWRERLRISLVLRRLRAPNRRGAKLSRRDAAPGKGGVSKIHGPQSAPRILQWSQWRSVRVPRASQLVSRAVPEKKNAGAILHRLNSC